MSTLLELSEIGESEFTPEETTLLGNFESEDQRLSAETLLSPTKIIIAASSIITGPGIFEGNIVRILFTSAITGSDTSTALSITYNGDSYPVKVGKQGALSNFVASYVNSAYTYLQAYTTLELAFDGTQFIIIGNPVVLSSSDYTIYADGSINYTSQPWEDIASGSGFEIQGKITATGKYINLRLVDYAVNSVGQQITQLPEEYCPSATLRLVYFYFSATTFEISIGFCQIEPTGVINCFPSTGAIYGDILAKIS